MWIVRPLPVRSGFFVMAMRKMEEVPALELPKMREVRQFDSKLHMNGENAENFFEMRQRFDKDFGQTFL